MPQFQLCLLLLEHCDSGQAVVCFSHCDTGVVTCPMLPRHLLLTCFFACFSVQDILSKNGLVPFILLGLLFQLAGTP